MENLASLPERNPHFNVYGKASSCTQVPTEKEFLVYNQDGKTVHYGKDLANRALPVLVRIQIAALPALVLAYVGYAASSLAPRAFSRIAVSESTVLYLGGVVLVCAAVRWILNDWLEKTKANYDLYLTTEMRASITARDLPRAMVFATKMTGLQERAQRIGEIERNDETQRHIIRQSDSYLQQGLLDDALQCIYRITDEGERLRRLKKIAPIYRQDDALIAQIEPQIRSEQEKIVQLRNFSSITSMVSRIQNATKRDAYFIKILKLAFYPAFHQEGSSEALKETYLRAAAFTRQIKSQQAREYALLDIARELIPLQQRQRKISPRDVLDFLFEIDSFFNDQDPHSPLISDADLEEVIDLLLPSCGPDAGVDAIMLLCDPEKQVAKLQQFARRYSFHPESAQRINRFAHACVPREGDPRSAELMNAYRQERLLAYLVYQEKTNPNLQGMLGIQPAYDFTQIRYAYDITPGERELALIGRRIHSQLELQSQRSHIVTERDEHCKRLKRYYDYVQSLPIPAKRVRFSEEVQRASPVERACLLVPA